MSEDTGSTSTGAMGEDSKSGVTSNGTQGVLQRSPEASYESINGALREKSNSNLFMPRTTAMDKITSHVVEERRPPHVEEGILASSRGNSRDAKKQQQGSDIDVKTQASSNININNRTSSAIDLFRTFSGVSVEKVRALERRASAVFLPTKVYNYLLENPFNFYTVRLAFLLVLAFLGSAVVVSYDDISYLDAIFICISAVTSTGLVPGAHTHYLSPPPLMSYALTCVL